MKKAVSLLVVLAILVSMATSVFADDSTTFSDVPLDHWAYNEIQYFYNQNIVDGIGNDKFAPDDNVTREQLAKLISIIYGKTDYQATSQTFGDVTSDMWSYNYIESVKEYLTGYYPADGQAFYNPAAYATREDVAYALVKVSGLDKQISADTSVLEKFEDHMQISYNLREYMAIAVQSGLMQGYNGELRPQDGITRAETVTLLFRAIKRPVAEDDVGKVPDEKVEDDLTEENKPTTDVENDTQDEIAEKYDKYDIQVIKSNSVDSVSGFDDIYTSKLELEWVDGAAYADFFAQFKFEDDIYTLYRVKLAEIESCKNNVIKGKFDVTIDEETEHSNIDGVLTISDGTIEFNCDVKEYNFTASYDKITKKYKEKVYFKSSDSTIFSDNIISFKIFKTENEDIDMTSLDARDRINGYVEIIFGDDVMKDTKIVATVVVDNKDTYTIESKDYFERYSKSGTYVRLETTYNMYKNGKLIVSTEPTKYGGYDFIVVKKSDDSILLTTKNFSIFAEEVEWATTPLPAVPEDQPWELWADASQRVADITEVNGEEASGIFSIIYKLSKDIARVDSLIDCAEDEYVVEITETIDVKASGITAKFNITKNGELVAENVSGKISGMGGRLRDTVEFTTDDGNWNIKMYLSEISG